MKKKKVLTTARKDLVTKMLQQHFLRRKISITGTPGFILLDKDRNPVKFFHERTIKPLKDFLKKNDKGELSLNLSSIRQLHGKNF